MIQSYFFIPANHPKLEEKLNGLQADFFIIDLEDALDSNQLDNSLKRLELIKDKERLWIRPRMFLNNVFNSNLLKGLFDLGFRNFVIPKVRNISHINQVESCIGESGNVILLVENPEFLLNLRDILNLTTLNVVGLGFGSQDYTTETGMKHDPLLLRFPRFIIATIAKAFGISCIDIACMDVEDEDTFKKEVSEAINMGFDGKFIIHPKQLDVLNSYPLFSNADIDEAEQVLAEYERLNKPSVFVFNGRAIEPPHIKNYLKIKAWRLRYGRK